MTDDNFAKKADAAKRELREAIAAIDRATRGKCQPHYYACMSAAKRHAVRGAILVEMAMP